MQLASLAKSSKILGRTLRRHSPSILTGLAVGGLITTVLMAVRATPKALQLIKEDEKYYEEGMSNLDILKVAWKPYLPAALMAVSTIGCIVGANHISLRRTAALAGLYSLAETTLKEYQAKVIETVGKNKEEVIRNEISHDKINRNPPDEKTIIITGQGSYLFYDSLSGRYFRSDIEKLRKIQNDFNHQLLGDMFISLNELYYDIGLKAIDLGGEQGWSYNELLEFKFTSMIADTGEPCVVLEYSIKPKYYSPRG